MRDRGSGRRLLAALTLLYFVVSLAPVLLLVRISFSDGPLSTEPHGFTLAAYRFVLDNPTGRAALLRSLRLAGLTALVATPLGVCLAFGLSRWSGPASSFATYVSILPLVVPQIVLASGYFLIAASSETIRFGTGPQLAAHITVALAFVVIIVRARVLGLGRELEEMAMDLGASQAQAIVRVQLPLLAPAIVAGALIAFAVSMDNFVLSQWLCIELDCTTVPMLLYSRQPSPPLGALASLSALLSLGAVSLAGLVWWTFPGRARPARGRWILLRLIRP